LEQKFRKTLGTLGQKTYYSSYVFFFFSSLPAKRIKKNPSNPHVLTLCQEKESQCSTLQNHSANWGAEDELNLTKK
jgi:hypothetical protein